MFFNHVQSISGALYLHATDDFDALFATSRKASYFFFNGRAWHLLGRAWSVSVAYYYTKYRKNKMLFQYPENLISLR